MESMIPLYQQCIKTLLSQYESSQAEDAVIELICDDERMRYLVLRVGWRDQKRIYLCLLHIDIIDDTVIIQCNNTEDKVASELVQLGIPKDKIGLGFLPPVVRSDAYFRAGTSRETLQRQREQILSAVPV